MANHNDPLSLVYSKQSLQKTLFKELEEATIEMRTKRESLDQMAELVFAKYLTELRTGKMDIYKSVVCYTKLVDSFVKLENLRMASFDRLHGVARIETEEAEDAAKDTDRGQHIAELAEALLSRKIRKKFEDGGSSEGVA